jgi:alpha-galactosidase
VAVIKNPELLAFHQDTTVAASAKPYKSGDLNPPEYYAGTSSKGVHAFVINTGGSAATKTITFSQVPGLGSGSYKVHDMWAGADVGTFSGSYTTPSLQAHDNGAYLITPA